MNTEQLASELLDSKRFCDLMGMAAGFKKRSLTDEDRVRLIAPIVALVASKLLDGQTEPVKPKVRPGPAQVAKEALPGPQFDLGSLGDAHGLPFDPFEHQSTEPDPVNVMLDQGAQLVAALAKLPDKGLGEKVKFTMPMDWNAGQAAIFFEAALKDGGKWMLAGDGEGVRIGPDKNSWDVTAIRAR